MLVEIFLDIEATGPDPEKDRIFQLAAVASVEKTRVGTPFSAFVNPQMPISPIAQKITGKSTEDVQTAPLLGVVLETFFIWLNSIRSTNSCVFIAHSGTRFDFLILWKEMHRLGYDVEETMRRIGWAYIFDTYLWLKKFAPRQKLIWIKRKPSFRLSNLHLALCGHHIANAHDALADCWALFHVCQALPDLIFSTTTCFDAQRFLSNKRFHSSWDVHNRTY